MSNMAGQTISGQPEADRLFSSLAEQVKLPFVQVLQAAELLAADDPVEFEKNRQTIQTASRSGIRLIDGYLLAVKLQKAGALQLEPVSLSSLLYDTAEDLNDFAKAHDCQLQLQIDGRYGPVMSNSTALKLALINLGYSFVGSIEGGKHRVIKLGVRRNPSGISAGIFADNTSLSGSLLKRARALQGAVHQPMSGFASDNAAGIFVADSLFQGLNTNMRVAKLGGMNGLAATLKPSLQLSLV